MDHLSKKEVRALAAQLRSPEGTEGLDLGQKMHETNINMTMSAVKALDPADGDRILEIGHGNARHVKQVLGIAENLQYTGLDISETMYEEARQTNASFIEENRASFHLYQGETFPFPDTYFHKIMTVNTIYFWEAPLSILKETHRVLKPGGLISIGFVEKSFMKTLPFAQYGFQLYDTEDVKMLAGQSKLQVADIETQTEQVESKDGSEVDRIFTTITLKK